MYRKAVPVTQLISICSRTAFFISETNLMSIVWFAIFQYMFAHLFVFGSFGRQKIDQPLKNHIDEKLMLGELGHTGCRRDIQERTTLSLPQYVSLQFPKLNQLKLRRAIKCDWHGEKGDVV